MSTLADRITAELAILVGQPFVDCWRAANMQIFGFGPRLRTRNRKGEEVEITQFRLHVQCRWRMVDGSKILFGRDDLNYPADETIPVEDFDWDKNDSVLDVKMRTWFAQHRDTPVHVVIAIGDVYGGFRIDLERGFAVEGFPCDSDRGEYSEHWRLFGHRTDGSHFVVKGDGVACEDRKGGA